MASLTDKNKAVAYMHHKDVLEQGRVELIDSYWAPDGSVPEMLSAEKLKNLFLWWHKAAPGFKITLLDQIAEGDRVVNYWQADVTYSIPTDPPPDEPFLPLGKPVHWRGMSLFRLKNEKVVAEENQIGWTDLLVDVGAIPFKELQKNKETVRKFIDGLNRQDTALLNEVCTPEIARNWIEALPWMDATMKDHRIEIVDMVADSDGVAVKMATSGYHTGELHGLPPTGKKWSNRVFTFFRLVDGKITEVDALADVENIIRQIGGAITQTGK